MPTVRIRTHDPDAVLFFTAKLADCGFDVEFAAPGQRVRGDVDLEITVNFTKKSSPSNRDVRVPAAPNRSSLKQNRVEWTTPYHAEAPDLADEFLSRGVAQSDSKDRELARILAGGPKRGDMFVIGIQDQEDREVLSRGMEPIEAPRPIQRPTLASQPSKVSPKPKMRNTPPRSRAVSRRSFLEQYSAFAAAIILPVAIIIFYLSLFGDPSYAVERSEPLSMQPHKNLSAAPVMPTAQSLVPVSDQSQPSAEAATDSITSDPINSAHSDTQLTSAQRRQTRVRHASALYEEPEVTVRHFPATPDQQPSRQSSNDE